PAAPGPPLLRLQRPADGDDGGIPGPGCRRLLHRGWLTMPSAAPPGSLRPLPYLEYFPEPGGLPQRVALRCFPFAIGRDPAANLVISSRRVSQAHAVIPREGERCYISDVCSTNGTFVNGQRVACGAPLDEGDIVHLAHMEFRFGYESGGPREDLPPHTEM